MRLSSGQAIYLDYNATTPLAPKVMSSISRHLHTFGNPSSIHKFGDEANRQMEHARLQVAKLLSVESDEIIFTSGGTESVNMAIKGVIAKFQPHPCHIITSQIEHAALLETCRDLERQGHEVTYLPVSADGMIDPQAVLANIRPSTRLISIMHANHEIGVIQPLHEIGKIARQFGIVFHSDAVQTVGKLHINIQALPVDLVSLTAHKFYGPKGVGALYVKSGVKLHPLIHGGAQEAGRRAGTENILGIIGFGAACELARHELVHATEWNRLKQLRDRLCDGLMHIEGTRLNGSLDYGMANTLNISFQGIKGDALATALALQSIAVSTGSACHALREESSHVLKALGLSEEWRRGAIRFSLGLYTTIEQIDVTIEAVRRSVRGLRSMLPVRKYHYSNLT